MAQVWIYVLGASNDPDKVDCAVPRPVDDELIFFGPCMPDIRKRLRGLFLGPDCSHNMATDNIFIIGINAVNEKEIRKVVWAGRVLEIMTFAEANKRLKGDRFQKLRKHQFSPLHVCPVLKDGKLVGYEHASELHKDEEWVNDLVSKSARSNVIVEGGKLMLRQGTPWKAFDRDCCMLLKNIFFASGQGIEFDNEALDILREAQPDKSDIDNYAVFGRTKGKVNGRRRWGLEIPDNLTNRFVAWLERRSAEGEKHQRSEGYGPAKTCCT